MCERVRVWVCAVASKRGRALNGEMGEVRGRLCASAQVRDTLCAKSIVSPAPTTVRIVTGCGCGSETGNFSLLRRNFSWGEVHEYGMPRTKDFALRTNPGWALIQILRSSTTLRLQCVRVYVRVVMQKGVREREKEIER